MRLAPGSLIEADALLFDMDGTLVDSTAAIVRVWGRWAKRHDIDPRQLLHALHGVRIADTVRRFAPPGTDITREVDGLMAEERGEVDGIHPVGGAAEFLNAIPASRWAVVTSADRALAEVRMWLAGLPAPRVLIAAEDVTNGKPHPEGYLRAAEALGRTGPEVLVLEDSSAGLAAGRAAGFRVIGVAATRTEPFPATEAWIENFTAIRVEAEAASGPIRLRIRGQASCSATPSPPNSPSISTGSISSAGVKPNTRP